ALTGRYHGDADGEETADADCEFHRGLRMRLREGARTLDFASSRESRRRATRSRVLEEGPKHQFGRDDSLDALDFSHECDCVSKGWGLVARRCGKIRTTKPAPPERFDAGVKPQAVSELLLLRETLGRPKGALSCD